MKNIILTARWEYFKDIRFLALLAFAALMLMTAWSAVRIVETNYHLQQNIARIDQENQVAELENQNIRLTNAFYETDTYVELAARRQYNKGLPGEKLILVPKAVAMQRASNVKLEIEPAKPPQAELTGYKKNLSDWFQFFFNAS